MTVDRLNQQGAAEVHLSRGWFFDLSQYNNNVYLIKTMVYYSFSVYITWVII